jgi:hypothetical protein
LPPDVIVPKLCVTTLKDGCYTLSFVPKGTPVFGTRFRGTMRVDKVGSRVRFSGDLYRWRLLDDIVIAQPGRIQPAALERAAHDLDVAADTGGTIPIHRRSRYHSYLEGTSAQLVSFRRPGQECTFTLDLNEWVYNHPATGFSGSFDTTPTRAVRFVMRKTSDPNVYTGEAFAGTTSLGSVSLRWVSKSFRRAELRVHTLQGAVAPPANVAGSTFSSIFADAGYDLTVIDGGQIPLPAALAGTNINACWSELNLHTLMSSVPGYDPAILDKTWRIELVSVPAALNCGRGVMFDSALGADPNAIAREGSATFSHDGYPAGETPHYDTAAGQQQRNVPRAFLRSATHEVGHAFNQIHQGFEGGNDNSIMTPTPGVAAVLGAAGTFPDGIDLRFNATVKGHLRHLPDPAVRPGAMDFFGSAVSAPQAADVAWPDDARLTLTLSSPQVALGEPVRVSYALSNAGEFALTAPDRLNTESLTVRISVTDPTGRVTFMRPPAIDSCPTLLLEELPPGASVDGDADVFWGRDGFAFEMPGRHIVEAIALWYVGGVPVAASDSQPVFVTYPTTTTDNDVAATMLDPVVGLAVATGDAETVGAAVAGIGRRPRTATDGEGEGADAGEHPAIVALRERGLLAE